MDLTSYLLGKKASGGGGGGVVGPDWGQIGYEEIPQSVLTSYNYAIQIMNNWDATQTDLNQKFKDDLNLVYMPLVDTSNATNMLGMFQNDSYLQSVPKLNTSKVWNMNSMFNTCSGLKSVELFDTSNCERMQEMFKSCRQLESVPKFDMGKCTWHGYMFSGCYQLKNVPAFNAPKATSFNNMFESCQRLTNDSLDNILQMCLSTTSAFTGTKTLYSMGIRSGYYPAATIQSLPHYQDFIDAGWTIGY